jgi:hypothetical protein
VGLLQQVQIFFTIFHSAFLLKWSQAAECKIYICKSIDALRECAFLRHYNLSFFLMPRSKDHGCIENAHNDTAIGHHGYTEGSGFAETVATIHVAIP